ncbi:hypothetical protein SAMN05660668_00780 [Pseudobutyrivibrio sp. AR14]|uniref:hypothetical protein n=1 Tax=Pseudobutyrivibrio sp. AR14 TaxID=1520804 RepID=UPI00087FE45F|nr:hypothetical protein [Pseudobutyrivibrio sp. AR14]SCX91416.1 hypothetical protein SAMN05660668_00780 [Pseudobutyrivibrio sp. AR14]
MALINTKDPYIFILAEEIRKNARAEIASLQYSRNRLLNSDNPKDIMTINAYKFRIAALKQYEKDAKTIVKEKKRIEKTTDDPKERQELLEDYAENVNLETIRKLKFASKIIPSEQKTKLYEDYFNSPTNNTGTNASNKHVTFDSNNTYHETYPTVNSFDDNSDISADDNESFVDSVIDNQVDDDNLLDSVDDIQVDGENLFDSVENFRDDDNISLYNYGVNNQDEGDNLHDSVDDIQVDGENLVEYNLGESSFEDYPYDNESFVEDYTDDNESLIENYTDDNESLFNDVLDTVQDYYDRTSITPTKDDPEWDKLRDEKDKQNSKIEPHINDLTSRYHNLIKKEEQHKKKNNFITAIKKKTASIKFNTYYKYLIHRYRVDKKYLNSQINAAYSVIGHDYYQPKENSKSNSLLSGAKQKVVVNPNNTGANQGITIPERTTSRNQGMTPRINRH